MTTLANSASSITASLKHEDIFEQVLEQTCQALKVEAASLALIDQQNQEIEFQASTSQGSHNITGVRLPIGKGIAGWVAKRGEGIIVQDVHRDPRFFSEIDQTTGFTTSAITCAPILYNNEVIGVIEALNPMSGSFNSDALILLAGIGNLAGPAIHHAHHITELMGAHDRYHDLFMRNINSMLITNWDGLILEGNREAAILFGYDQETLQNLEIGQIHHLDHEILGEGFSRLTSGETLTYEAIIQTRNLTEIPVEVRVHAIQAETSSYLQWVFRNIQERKELDQLRDDLLSSIYHDLRSPLSNVISSLDVLANMLSLDRNPAILSLFNIAVRSTERIQRLTNSLLDINRLEAGHPIVNLQPIKPITLIQDALDAVSPIAKNKNQQIRVEPAVDLHQVIVDADMIRRVLINLTENAIKYSPPEGIIKIGARDDGEWVYFWVEDTGPGVPLDKQSRIFEKFTRLHEPGSAAGFGFGLAYCRLAIEGHGGRIWMEEAGETGARFIFTLPISENKE
jgi:PAS domain S-box-containing protein